MSNHLLKEGNISSISPKKDINAEHLSLTDFIPLLRDFSNILFSSKTVDEASIVVGQVVQKMLKSSFGSVGIVEDEHLRFAYVYGVNWDVGGRMPLNSPGITTRAVRTGEVQFVPDTTKDKDFCLPQKTEKQSRSEIVIPVKLGNEVVAIINVESYEFDNYNLGDVQILEILGSYFSAILHLLRVKSQFTLNEERMDALHRYTTSLSLVDTFEKAAKIAADILIDLLKISTGSLSLIEGNNLKFHFIYGANVGNKPQLSLDGKGISVRAAVTGETQLVGDVTKDPDFVCLTEDFLFTRSELAVPLKINRKIIGVFNVISPQINAFSMDDLRLLEIFSVYLTSSIIRVRELEAINEYRKRLETLNELLLLLDTAETVEEIADISMTLLKKLYNSDYDSIVFIKDDYLGSLKLELKTFSRLASNGRGIVVRAVKEKKIIHVADTALDPDNHSGEVDTFSELAVPIMVKDDVLGVLNLKSKKPTRFNQEDIKLAEAIASHIGATFQRIFLIAEQKRSIQRLIAEESETKYAKELTTVRTRFMSAATHEIRTPLTSINGYAGLIQEALEEGDYSKLSKYFEAVKRNAERLTRLTDDLLDVQRIMEDRLKVNKVLVNTESLMLSLEKEFNPLLNSKNQKLVIIDSFGETISVDPDRIMQVLLNLLRNASKFSDIGSTINLSIERINSQILFSVKDTGIGLREEDLVKIFTPFSSVRGGSNKDGTGLGLSISKGIVELHGGRIWAESEGVGKGSVFKFTLPLG